MTADVNDLRVIKIEDDGHVWISFESICKLDDIEDATARLATSMTCSSIASPLHDQPCAVNWGGKWRRGKIDKLYTSSRYKIIVGVFLYDYAETITVPLTELIDIDGTLLALEDSLISRHRIAPPTATPTLPPDVKSSWSDAVERRLIEMGGVRDGWGVQLKGSISTNDTLQLHCISSADGKMVDINDTLIKEGFLELEELYEIQSVEDKTSHHISLEQMHHAKQHQPIVSNNQKKQLEKLKQYSIPQLPSSDAVYVDGSSDYIPWFTLDQTPFEKFICSSLIDRGFTTPTPIQSHGWYLVWSGIDTVLVSPANSGKTLAYLLPLLCLSSQRSNEQDNEPLIVILTTHSYKSWLINNQLCHGVDVLVSTPSSLSKLMNKGVIRFTSLKHLVFDDMVRLFDCYWDDVQYIMREVQSHDKPVHIVSCASFYSPSYWDKFKKFVSSPVTVVTDAMEILAMKKIKTRAVYCSDNSLQLNLMSMIMNMSDTCRLVICVCSDNEASSLLQSINLHCYKTSIWTNQPTPSTNISIVCDDYVSDLCSAGSRYDIDVMIHYTLPNNKLFFKKRLSLLTNSASHPSQIILISSQSILQSIDVLGLLTRCGATPPPELVAMATRRKNSLKCAISDLCLDLKSFGLCSDMNCKMAHSLDELMRCTSFKMPHPPTPKDGYVQVLVKSVSSPCQLWVELLSHTPLRRGDMPIIPVHHHLSQLSMDLSLYYNQDRHQHGLHSNPSIGDVCCLMMDDGCYHRVKILEFSRPLDLFFHHKEQAKVRLIDTGIVTRVDVNQLFTLPTSFKATPPFVLEAYLCHLKSPDLDWSPEAINVASALLEGHTLTGCVALSVDGTIWLDPVEERIHLDMLGATTALERPHQSLIKADVAIPNDDHLINLRSSLGIHSPMPELVTLDDMRFVTMTSGCVYNVSLTAIETIEHFYVQMSTSKDILNDLSNKLNPSHLSPALHHIYSCPIKLGGVYAAKFPPDQKWYRVTITDERDEMNDSLLSVKEFLCFFVDYGDLEWVDHKDIQAISHDLLELPFQAMCCSLSGASGNNEFAADIHEKLWDLICDKQLHLKVVTIDDGFTPYQFPSCTQYCVNITTDEGTDVIELLNDTECNDIASNNNDKGCELSLMMSLLLSEDSSEIVSEFIPFVLTRHNNIFIDESHCDQLVEYLNESHDDPSCIIKGFHMMAISNPLSLSVMSSHRDLCKTFISLLKDTANSDVRLCVLQLLQHLSLSSCSSAQHLDVLINPLFAAIMSVYSQCRGHSLNCCIDIISCLLATNQCLPTNEFNQYVFDQLPNAIHQQSIIRLLCSHLKYPKIPQIVIDNLGHALSYFMCFSIELQIHLLSYILLAAEHSYQIISSLLIDHFKHIKQLFNSNHQVRSLISKILQFDSESLMMEAIIDDEPDSPSSVTLDSGCCSNDAIESIPHVESSIQSLTPKVLWSQTHQLINLSVQLRDCESRDVSCDVNIIEGVTVIVQCVVGNSNYGFNLELYGSIKDFDVNFGNNEVLLKLRKLHHEMWPHLTMSERRPAFIGIDYDRWTGADSDDEQIDEFGWETVNNGLTFNITKDDDDDGDDYDDDFEEDDDFEDDDFI